MATEPVAMMQWGPVAARAPVPPVPTQRESVALYRSPQRREVLVVRLLSRPPVQWLAPVRRSLQGVYSVALVRAWVPLALDQAVLFQKSPLLLSQRIWKNLPSFRLWPQRLLEHRVRQEKSDSENCPEALR